MRPIFHEFDPRPSAEAKPSREGRNIILSEAAMAVLWLNAAKGTPSYRRVLAIQEMIADLNAGYEALQLRMSDGAADDGLTGEFSRLAELHGALNQALSRYSLCPQSKYFVWQRMWTVPLITRDTEKCVEVPYGDPAYGLKLVEATAVHSLLKLTETRSFHHVRLCEQCRSTWIVSVRSIDRFCGKECREAFYPKSPDYRARKNESQKRYRENLKRLPNTQPKRFPTVAAAK